MKSAFADIYDRVGLVIAGSLIWFLTLLPTFIIAMTTRSFSYTASFAILWHILSSPVVAGVFYLAANIVKRESPAVADIAEGARTYWASAWKLAALQLFITAVLIADVIFFYTLVGATGNMLFIPLAALSFYALIFWGIMFIVQWPLLIEQRPTTLKILTKSFLLVADNLSFTTGIYFAIILLSILCLSPGMALLYMGTAAVMSTSALRELLRKYGLAAIPREPGEDTGWRVGDYQ